MPNKVEIQSNLGKIFITGTVTVNNVEKSLSSKALNKIVRSVEIKLTRLSADEIKNSTDDSNNYKSPRYHLRKRKCEVLHTEEKIEPPKKRICREILKIVRKPKFVRAQSNELGIGTVVLAHMPTYSEWPARILNIEKTRVNVIFFGENLTGTVKPQNIGLIDRNSELIKYLLKKKINKYKKAVLEMEHFQNVPSHLSIIESYVILLLMFKISFFYILSNFSVIKIN